MKIFIKEHNYGDRSIIDFGWGNGYVLIPEGHPVHGVDWSDISINVNGGLTFSRLVTEDLAKRWDIDDEDIGKWCVGFDTGHHSDTLDKWPKEKVLEETMRLENQLALGIYNILINNKKID